MPISWRSLESLKGNLGQIGEGVTNYLKNRQEDEERQQNFEAMKSFMGTPDGARFDPNMASLAFTGNGFRAAPAVRSMIDTKHSLAPDSQVIGGQETGYRALKRDKFTGDFTVGDQILPGKNASTGSNPFAPGNNISGIELYDIAKNHPDEAIRKRAQTILDAQHADNLEIAKAKAITQSGLSEGRDIRDEKRSGVRRAALDYGDEMSAQQKIKNDISALLTKMGPGRDYIYVGSTKYTRAELQKKYDAAHSAWEQARKQLNKIKIPEGEYSDPKTGEMKKIQPGQTIGANMDGWQDHPAGFQYRIIEDKA